ncbi:acetylglutamate kinase [Puniceicoccales bacterium CK1056]|uniref:Acetylglutamate kinase n=1 Tax=Oceanipulchritudo coccoides TaxID=2706888 RepID=A0A6B2M438_9BACT|nr:acetylglutamate kinase [Oceanipulchritudo coccoides]NDV62595.1 acetylglutamate kinase [Oceanipulchritudo coccoides]
MPVDINIQAKTEVLLEALPYIQTFKGSTFVVKFGGSFMDTERARIGVATDLVFLATVGIHVIVVHGGGPAINKAMSEALIEPVWKNGLRYTDERTVQIVEKTLNENINLSVCENIQIQKGHPIAVKGQDVFRCKRLEEDSDGNPVDLGYVGSITSVESSRLKRYLEQDYMPIVSPIGRDAEGQLYNTNADTAAAHLAAAIGARRLVYLCDVPGLLRDKDDPSSLISSISQEEVPAMKAEGIIGTGMLPKVESAINALTSGVHRVHLIDGTMPHSILLEIFTDKGVGTEIVHAS